MPMADAAEGWTTPTYPKIVDRRGELNHNNINYIRSNHDVS